MSDSTTYTFQPGNTPAEIARLDSIHQGCTGYFGGRLSLAPLEDTVPKSILEIGCGSGAWAIAAALQFPEATVTAIDISPLPNRELPPNVQYKRHDATALFPFEEGSFDIVHSRLVLMHIPGGEDVLRRACKLVKPGGWIIVEDPNDDETKNGDQPAEPAMAKFVQSWLTVLRSRGANPTIGKDHEGILMSTGLFSEVNVRKVAIPYSLHSINKAENILGLTWLENMRQTVADLPRRFSGQGMTDDLGKLALAAVEAPGAQYTTDIYFVWAKRSVN